MKSVYTIDEYPYDLNKYETISIQCVIYKDDYDYHALLAKDILFWRIYS